MSWPPPEGRPLVFQRSPDAYWQVWNQWGFCWAYPTEEAALEAEFLFRPMVRWDAMSFVRMKPNYYDRPQHLEDDDPHLRRVKMVKAPEEGPECDF